MHTHFTEPRAEPLEDSFFLKQPLRVYVLCAEHDHRTWHHLGTILAHLGTILAPSWHHFGSSRHHLGTIFAHLGAMSAPSWRHVRSPRGSFTYCVVLEVTPVPGTYKVHAKYIQSIYKAYTKYCTVLEYTLKEMGEDQFAQLAVVPFIGRCFLP